MPKREFDLPSARGIVWDLDNTLYRADEAIIDAFNVAMARAVRRAGVDLEMEEAAAMARRSFETYGYSGYVFVQEYGIDRDALHYEVHGTIDEKVIRDTLAVRDLFAAARRDHVLVTHSARVWAEKVLSHLGLRDFFPDGRVLAFEHYDFESKGESRRAFEMALDRIGHPAREVVVVEDTLKNLRIPREMGFGTVLIHHGRPPADIPGFVDFSCANAAELLKMMGGEG